MNSIKGIPQIGSKRGGVSKVKGSNKEVKVSPISTPLRLSSSFLSSCFFFESRCKPGGYQHDK